MLERSSNVKNKIHLWRIGLTLAAFASSPRSESRSGFTPLSSAFSSGGRWSLPISRNISCWRRSNLPRSMFFWWAEYRLVCGMLALLWQFRGNKFNYGGLGSVYWHTGRIAERLSQGEFGGISWPNSVEIESCFVAINYKAMR